MTRKEKIAWLQQVINNEEYINERIEKLAMELILILYRIVYA